MADYYQVLGVSSNASEADIRAAYRRKAKMYHPDINKSPDAHAVFVIISAAYDTLINPAKRRRYNSKNQTSSSNSFETYQEWAKAQKAKAEHEARLRYYEFLKKRENFRQSRYYWLAQWVTKLARIVAYFFGAAIITVCLYLIYTMHFMFLFFFLPFICGGIFLIIWTNDWYKETRKYF